MVCQLPWAVDAAQPHVNRPRLVTHDVVIRALARRCLAQLPPCWFLVPSHLGPHHPQVGPLQNRPYIVCWPFRISGAGGCRSGYSSLSHHDDGAPPDRRHVRLWCQQWSRPESIPFRRHVYNVAMTRRYRVRGARFTVELFLNNAASCCWWRSASGASPAIACARRRDLSAERCNHTTLKREEEAHT